MDIVDKGEREKKRRKNKAEERWFWDESRMGMVIDEKECPGCERSERKEL